MKQTQGRITISIDGYTRVCLTAIAVLMTILIIGLWASGPEPMSGEQAVAAARRVKPDKTLLDARAQRMELLKEARETNKKLDKIVAVLKGGEMRVVLAESKTKKGKSNAKKRSTSK